MGSSTTERDTEIRRSLVSGKDAVAVAADYDVTMDVVNRIAVIAGLKVPLQGLYEPDVYYKPCPEAQQVLAAVGWRIADHLDQRDRCSPRDAALCDSLLIEDLTLDEAGARAGFKARRERMRQILHKHTGLSPRDLKDYRAEMREARRLVLGRREVHRLATDLPDATAAELAERSGLTTREVEQALGWDEALRRRPRNTWSVSIDDETVLAELRRVSELPGGSPLSGPFYDEHRRPEAVGSVRITQRFQTWTAACAAAGVTSRTRDREYSRQWSNDDLLEWARMYIEEVGAAATYKDFGKWLRERRDEGAPSAQTLRNYVGSWHAIVQLAIGANPDEPSPDGDTYSEIDIEPAGDQASLFGLPDSRWDVEETDSEVLTKVRLEQSHLRRYLLGGRRSATCAICGRVLPEQLLLAAHIVPRRMLDGTERRDFESAAMLACALGCDALFEWGYIVVDHTGRVIPAREPQTGDLAQLVHEIAGQQCGAHTPFTAERFAQHRELHTSDHATRTEVQQD